MTKSEPTIGVVHLVRKVNGLQPFETFLKSYQKHPSGQVHDLIIVYKGFSERSEVLPYENLMAKIPHQVQFVSDRGFDLLPYFKVAESTKHDLLLFINSFSVILADDWLNTYANAMAKQNVAMVGATGSWCSVGPRKYTTKSNLPIWKKLVRPIAWYIVSAYFKLSFSDFPNPHIRTNSFLIRRDVMLRIKPRLLITKMQAYRMESGKKSITKQVVSMGYRVVIIGKNKETYDVDKWHQSDIFWMNDQSNLLIADNQTKKYDLASREEKLRLESAAWTENFGKIDNPELKVKGKREA